MASDDPAERDPAVPLPPSSEEPAAAAVPAEPVAVDEAIAFDESVVVDESPVEALLGAAATADLIVVGTHGRRGPGRWWLGSVAERVVRAATIPVLVTRSATTPPHDVFERLVLLQDGSAAGEAPRSCAEHLARLAGGTLVDGGAVTRCESDILRRASLVVMAVRSDRPSWGITDPVAKVLGASPSPVLFIPEH